MLALFKNHGPIAFGILIAGIIAIVTSLMSVAMSKKRAGAKVGLLALGFVALTSTLTVGAVMSTRLKVDRAAKELDEPAKTQFVVAAYAETGGLSKLGVALGGVALVGALIGTMRGLSVRDQKDDVKTKADSKREPELGEMSDSSLGLGALVVGSLALFSLVAAFIPLVMRPKNAELDADDPARGFQKAESLLGEGQMEEGCKTLEEAYAKGGDPKRAKLRSVEALVAECFDQRIERALSASDRAEFEKVTSELEATKMPLDESQKKRLEEVTAMKSELQKTP